MVAARDEARRRIVRDLHDGAQQRLVTLALELRAYRDGSAGGRVAHRGGAARLAVAQLQEADEELRELAHGVLPAILTQEGLGPASSRS